MKKIALGILFFVLTPFAKDTSKEEVIAIYECRNGYLNLIWHNPKLTDKEIRTLKQKEKTHCNELKEVKKSEK